jgi:hypothetical protein
MAVAVGARLLATFALASGFASASEAEPPLPPLPVFESSPPNGVILEQPAVDEPVAEVVPEIQLTSADVIMVQDDGDGTVIPESQAERRQDAQPVRQTKKDREAAKGDCGEQSKECREALKMLRDDGIETIELDIRVGGRPGSDYPCECRLEGETFQPRRFATTMMTWKAAGNCHKPLYFEDWNLERYGHSHGALDPVLSAAHFFVTLPVLPYKMGVELPWECVYPLGYYRPGSCAPWTVPAVPISCRGFAVEAATVTGLVFLLP